MVLSMRERLDAVEAAVDLTRNAGLVQQVLGDTRLAGREITLPLHSRLADEDVTTVAEAVARAVASAR